MQNVYTNNCMQNGSHISTYFDPLVVQLSLETYWLSIKSME